MTAKDWLSRGWRLNEEIELLKEAKRRAYERCTATTKPLREPVCGSAGGQDPLADYAALGEEIDRMIAKLMRVKRTALLAIQRVEGSVCRQILIARYVNFQKWEQIADRMHYSPMQISRLHERALREIEPFIERML